MRTDVVIMDFSGVYSFMNMPEGEVVDCRDIVGCDCYCDAVAAGKISGRIANVRPGAPSGIHFIDSGDYHYVTKFWTDRIREPFNIFLFDHHPDMQEPEFPELLSCGGWMQAVASNPFSRKALIAGSNPSLSKESLSAPERVWLIDERHLYAESLVDAMPFFDKTLPVYLSIDKDVLGAECASTDWDQGVMTLPMLESWLEFIFTRFRVIGVDVCGEKPMSKGGTEYDWAINSQTNIELASFMKKMLPDFRGHSVNLVDVSLGGGHCGAERDDAQDGKR